MSTSSTQSEQCTDGIQGSGAPAHDPLLSLRMSLSIAHAIQLELEIHKRAMQEQARRDGSPVYRQFALEAESAVRDMQTATAEALRRHMRGEA